ncbi:helix-turn-helix transcriptional regulator [Flavobacterium alkalisoli]|uniref:Helix-turn-helix transcriptional regulator n=1 Tax=Flavobacterium alkalisoli TaxID=2602769 RepID=A0A5B9FUX7_9FLAO|nr:helix-turn-helix transcriptional regulator [Flavobacterium alkalisoli]QEE50765.1 helix-turn-helix transcriptional regulator [Flavobacterium alkalisoli]
MINTEDFIKRLETILDYYSISASVFADQIGVQRSGLSHLLSGRNKPSLDFVMRITDNYPEVDLYWLLNGKGSFPKGEAKHENENIVQLTPPPPSVNETKTNFEDLFSVSEKKTEEVEINEPEVTEQHIEEKNKAAAQVNNIPITYNHSEVEQVVIFYKDGTFKHYKPKA